MFEKAALNVKAVGARSRRETGKLWKYLKLRRVAVAVNAVAIVPLVAVGFWVYLVKERSLRKLQRTNELLAAQTAIDTTRGIQDMENRLVLR